MHQVIIEKIKKSTLENNLPKTEALPHKKIPNKEFF